MEEILTIARATRGAACERPGVNPDWWFQDDPDEEDYDEEITRYAKAICGGCPVQPACAEIGLAHPDEHGVWGGMSHDERLGIVLSDKNVVHRLSPVGGVR